MSEQNNNNIPKNTGNNGNPGKGNKIPGPPKPKFNAYWIYILLAAAFIGMQFINFGDTTKEVDWTTLSSMIKENKVSKIVLINKERVEIYEKPRKGKNPKLPIKQAEKD